ncbi:MAG: ABC-F family ATP-binding cassette domain-containing protein [Candidatus Electrothrix aestuarii]|uniref:ABC-F family ATP-binding cassette domain-containing protein n=1 Tax=Candidatus Electrothrix aestuarii TaxID=3062594 RepID=A0AAU8LXJ9_9BACT|nr:ABC-F family ATP-binding cassette domain-containing protein [Candidatus Electrothrix aestuarii]
MLTINNLSLQYGSKHLFREVSSQIHADDRIGLAGVNGTGKSTLMKIISGSLETDPGVINRASWFTVAYLPQEISIELGQRSLFDEAENAFDEALQQQQEFDEINHKLAELDQDSPELEPLLERQGELQHLLEGHDIFRIRPQIERILFGLGFSKDDLDRPVAEFSGGWIMRLLLAKLLLRRPALLLMDEPTNHLDLDSLTWLEEFLQQYQGAMMIISHDRSFLDRVTTKTWELSLGRLTTYKGNYSKYLVDKEERMELERAAYENQQAMIKQAEQFITRFRAKSTKAKQVQSRVKQLEKLERLELSETERTIHFSFPPAMPSGRDILNLDKVNKSFDGKQIFKNVNLNLQRGDKLGVVGVNGAGKTTLLKIMAGLEAAEGEISLGHNVILTYFGQHQAQELYGESSILDTVYHAAQDMTVTKVRSLLGAFLFTGDEVDKHVQVLSGGEKSRVALAKMLVKPANLMLLDEPTNHLDITSQEVLQEAMAQYEGSIIVVSHNRAFVNSFVNKVLEIRDGRAILHEGNIDDYLAARQQLDEEQLAVKKQEKQQQKAPAEAKQDASSSVDRKEERRLRAQRRQQLSSQLKPWKKKAKAAEKEIETLEERKGELEGLMADPELYADQPRWNKTSKEYNEVSKQLERQYAVWEEAQGKIEEIEGEE